MSSAWEKIAENRIAEALEQGEFENLSGRGKPLDLTAYFNTPAEDRMAFSILKNADIVPGEVELMSELEHLRDRLKACPEGPERLRIQQQIQTAGVKLALGMERRKRR